MTDKTEATRPVCKLTECQGKPRCRMCLAMDARYTAPPADQSERIAALEREVGALRKLYEVVIAHNRAGAAWGEQFGDLMAALGGIHAIDAARSKTI